MSGISAWTQTAIPMPRFHYKNNVLCLQMPSMLFLSLIIVLIWLHVASVYLVGHDAQSSTPRSWFIEFYRLAGMFLMSFSLKHAYRYFSVENSLKTMLLSNPKILQFYQLSVNWQQKG